MSRGIGRQDFLKISFYTGFSRASKVWNNWDFCQNTQRSLGQDKLSVQYTSSQLYKPSHAATCSVQYRYSVQYTSGLSSNPS